MGGYERAVGARYAAFLAEIGGAEADDLHRHILRAMVGGRPDGLTGWLDARHGPGAFARLFCTTAYAGPEPGVGS